MNKIAKVRPSKNHKKAKSALILVASVVSLLLVAACALSPEKEAEALLSQGNYEGAVEKAMAITDESSKASVLEKIMLKAMDAQSVFDYSELGIDDLTSYATSYGEKFADYLAESALAFMGGDKHETSSDAPIVDFEDTDCAAAIDEGSKVSDIYNAYKSVFSKKVQSALDSSSKDLDQRYRQICDKTTFLLSGPGIADYVTSSAVLGTMGAKDPHIDVKSLKNDVERFTLDYEKASESLGD